YRVGGFARRAVLIRLRFAAFRQESRGVATHGKWHNRNRYNGLRSAHAVATPKALATEFLNYRRRMLLRIARGPKEPNCRSACPSAPVRKRLRGRRGARLTFT